MFTHLAAKHPQIKMLSDAEKIEFVAAFLFQSVIKGLEHMHGKNLVHRDLKPDNIMVVEKDCVAKLADFTISAKLDPKKPNGEGMRL